MHALLRLHALARALQLSMHRDEQQIKLPRAVETMSLAKAQDDFKQTTFLEKDFIQRMATANCHDIVILVPRRAPCVAFAQGRQRYGTGTGAQSSRQLDARVAANFTYS